MGLDKKLASSRINRYESETRGIDMEGLSKLAETLGLPTAYLVAQEEDTADVILDMSKLTKAKRAEVSVMLGELVGESNSEGA